MKLKTLKGLALQDILTEVHSYVHRGQFKSFFYICCCCCCCFDLFCWTKFKICLTNNSSSPFQWTSLCMSESIYWRRWLMLSKYMQWFSLKRSVRFLNFAKMKCEYIYICERQLNKNSRGSVKQVKQVYFFMQSQDPRAEPIQTETYFPCLDFFFFSNVLNKAVRKREFRRKMLIMRENKLRQCFV